MEKTLLTFIQQQSEFNTVMQKQLQQQQDLNMALQKSLQQQQIAINSLIQSLSVNSSPSVVDKNWLPLILYGTIKETNSEFIYHFCKKKILVILLIL